MIHDVIIAGGGPVGLFLACELRLRRVSVLVLERMRDPHSPLKAGWMGMRGLNIPSVEAFYRRGLLEAMRKSSLLWINPGNQSNPSQSAPRPRFGGHFGGIMLDANKIDFSRQKYTIPGPSAAGGMISLEALELLLAERAREWGVVLRRGIEVTGFTEDEEGIVAHAGEESFRAQWLVGCDGGRSTVRKCAGFEFAGTDPELTGHTAAVEIADPEKLRPGFNLTAAGMYVYTPVPGDEPDRIGVVDFDGARFDREAAITREMLQQNLRRISGTDVTLTAVHAATSYTDRARQATTYRKGRVLLAGDAAHVHSPFGGQGLNTGLGDAMNLGWKLAAGIQGSAPEDLLDSYTRERHPVGAWALDWTRAQVAIMRPEPQARAIAAVIRDLIDTRDGTTYFAEKISGIALRYDLGENHPLAGCSAPDFEFADGTRLGARLRDGKGLFADFTGSGRLRALANAYQGRVNYVAMTARDSKGLTALLVRPDGFVAWVAESDPDPAAAEAVLRRWFGTARSGIGVSI